MTSNSRTASIYLAGQRVGISSSFPLKRTGEKSTELRSDWPTCWRRQQGTSSPAAAFLPPLSERKQQCWGVAGAERRCIIRTGSRSGMDGDPERGRTSSHPERKCGAGHLLMLWLLLCVLIRVFRASALRFHRASFTLFLDLTRACTCGRSRTVIRDAVNIRLGAQWCGSYDSSDSSCTPPLPCSSG